MKKNWLKKILGIYAGGTEKAEPDPPLTERGTCKHCGEPTGDSLTVCCKCYDAERGMHCGYKVPDEPYVGCAECGVPKGQLHRPGCSQYALRAFVSTPTAEPNVYKEMIRNAPDGEIVPVPDPPTKLARPPVTCPGCGAGFFEECEPACPDAADATRRAELSKATKKGRKHWGNPVTHVTTDEWLRKRGGKIDYKNDPIPAVDEGQRVVVGAPELEEPVDDEAAAEWLDAHKRSQGLPQDVRYNVLTRSFELLGAGGIVSATLDETGVAYLAAGLSERKTVQLISDTLRQMERTGWHSTSSMIEGYMKRSARELAENLEREMFDHE